MGSSMSANVSEETRRSPRINKHKHMHHQQRQQRIARSPSPRAIQHHPSLRTTAAATATSSIPRSPSLANMIASPSRNREPTGELWNLLRQRDWDAAHYRLRTHPRDAAWTPGSGEPEEQQQSTRRRSGSSNSTSGGGGTPLHQACRLRCPLPLLNDLVRAWPVALWTPDAAGWIPLHVLLVHSASTEALVAVIRSGGTAAACFVAGRSNNNGGDHNNNNLSAVGTALHLACRHGVAVPVLRELLRQCPAELLHRPEPCFPADLLWKQMERAAARGQHRGDGGGGDDNGDPTAVADRELVQRWNLLVAAARGRPLTAETDDDDAGAAAASLVLPGEPVFALHEVLEFEHRCTAGNHSAVPAYLRLHPEAAAAAQQRGGDANSGGRGRLPLHAACALWNEQRRSHQQPRDRRSRSYHRPGTAAALDTILRAHPRAASVRDAAGRLPLHILLAPWDDPDSSSSRNDNSANAQKKGLLPASNALRGGGGGGAPSSSSPWSLFLSQLVAAFPAALEARCPATGLHPFQLAAAAAAAGSNEHDDDGNATYALLRACPQAVLRNCSSSSSSAP